MAIGGSMHVTFPMIKEADFVNRGICGLKRDPDGYHWQVEELIVLEAIKASLSKETLDPVFVTCIAAMDSLLNMFGSTTSTNGNILEPMIRQALSYFNGWYISDLPFLGLNKASLPLWAKQQKIVITATGTAQTLGFTNDADFLSKRPPGFLLCTEPATRPDSVLYVTINYLT